MNDFLSIFSTGSSEQLFSPLDIPVVMTIACLCLILVTKGYQLTHRGTSYSQSYIHSLFLMGLCTAIVMMIIGSNIARAFSLVGALSIIRFRTAVKDVRDTAYLFFAVVIGMGCGTFFYVHTVVFTVASTAVMWFLHRTGYAAQVDSEEILKVTFKRGTEAPTAIDEFLGSHFAEYRLINSIRHFESDEDTQVFVVRSRGSVDQQAIGDSLAEIDNVTQAALYINDQQVVL